MIHTLTHNFRLCDEDYYWIVNVISSSICRKIVSVLEGGYKLESLKTAVTAHVRGLMM